MKFEDIKISTEKLDINYKFYYFLKELNGGQGLSDTLLTKFTEIIFAHKENEFDKIIKILDSITDDIKSDNRRNNLKEFLLFIKDDTDFRIFIFALKLLLIKPLLLAEAKLTEITEISNLAEIHTLSLQYDTISKSKPYYKRVNGALLCLLFFTKVESKENKFLSDVTENYINSLFGDYEYVKSKGIEPNQIFMIMFSESVDQSIVSDAGSSYEDRIFNLLLAIGVNKDDIRKTHDVNDSSTEFDFFFPYNSKKIGMGAKRTLRERYKQFIKTSLMSGLDLMIEVTLGIDLTEPKAESIIKHGVILFVADEIYDAKAYLQKLNGVYPASQFTAATFDQLTK